MNEKRVRKKKKTGTVMNWESVIKIILGGERGKRVKCKNRMGKLLQVSPI